MEKIILLQQENISVTAKITSEENNYAGPHLMDVLDNVQDLSSELLQLVRKYTCTF